jgi:MoxR-like ATPase
MTTFEALQSLKAQMLSKVIGQEILIDKIIITLLAKGNILIEGLPGLAKTRSVKTLAQIIDAKFSRIQFTPDISTEDIIGSERVYEENGKRVYKFHKGAIFGNIILADEINRAPAKVQSAMLEAMEEKQVTVAGQILPLPKLFMVLATQNPIEQHGTYPLSEAQKDRFLLHTKVEYVKMDDEYKMLKLLQQENIETKDDIIKIQQEHIFKAQNEVARVEVPEDIGRYIVELVFATRYPLRYSKQLSVMIDVGVSPRGTLALTQASQAYSWLRGQSIVRVQDIHSVIKDVFRHRIIQSKHTLDNGVDIDKIIDILIQQVPLPKSTL